MSLLWLWFIYYRECEGSDSLLETWGWHKGHQAAAGSWTDPSEWPLTHHHPAHAGQTTLWCLYQVFEGIAFLIRYFLLNSCYSNDKLLKCSSYVVIKSCKIRHDCFKYQANGEPDPASAALLWKSSRWSSLPPSLSPSDVIPSGL